MKPYLHALSCWFAVFERFARRSPCSFEGEFISFLFCDTYPDMFKTYGSFNRSLKILIRNKYNTTVFINDKQDEVGKRRYYLTFGVDIIKDHIIRHRNDWRFDGRRLSAMIAQVDLPTCTSRDNLRPPDDSGGHPIEIGISIDSITPSDVPTQEPSVAVHTDYPLLHSLGIPTSFDSDDDSSVIGNVLSELVSLYKKNNRIMSFNSVGNSKPGIVVAIPRSKDYLSFNRLSSL